MVYLSIYFIVTDSVDLVVVGTLALECRHVVLALVE